MKIYFNLLVVLLALFGFSVQVSAYNLDFRLTDENVFQPLPQPSFGRDNSTSGGYIFFDQTSKQEAAFQNLKELLGDLDRDLFSNCATTSAKCRFIDENNRSNHLAKIRQQALERAEKHLAKKQKGIEDIRADAVRVQNGQTPVQADLKASIERAIAELKNKADRSVAESQEAQRQNETVKIPQAKSDMENYIGLKDSLNRQLDEIKAEAKEHAEASKGELDNDASSISNGPIHRMADEERVEDAFNFQDDVGLLFLRKEYASDNIEGELQGRGQAYMSEGLVAQGTRLMERANTYRNYQNSNSLPYQGTRLSDKAKQDFDVGDLKSDSFVGYENIRLLNAYSDIPPEQLDEGLNLQFGLLAQSLVDTSPTDNLVGYFIKLEQAWGIIDFAIGAASGVYESGKGTVTGLYQVVSSPLATARGIKDAIVNYEKTWDALAAALEKNLDKLDNCGQDTRACGEVVGYIAGELGQSLVGGVALKAASKALKTQKGSLAVKELVDNTVVSARKWDSVESLVHVVKGNYQIATDGTRKLVSGMHTKLGFDNFMKLNHNAGKNYTIQNVTEFAAERIEAGGAILSQTLDNGVRRIQLPRDAWVNGDSFNKAMAYSESGQKLKGVKTLFPETWDLSKICEATEVIKGSVSSSREGNIITGVYERVNIRIVLEEGTDKVVTAYPFWRQ